MAPPGASDGRCLLRDSSANIGHGTEGRLTFVSDPVCAL